MSFKLPELPYAYDALEPYIDKETMEIHHTKHHQGYTDKLNKAISGTPLENHTIEEILSNVSQHNDAVRNNGGGFYNHNLFWRCMSPAEEQQQMPESLQTVLEQDFSSVEEFRKRFSKAAAGRFGSGWAWLIVNGDKLAITSTPNQDNPLMDVAETRGVPILGLDVWEHAYYLKYQNNRADYIEEWWNIVNWKEVARRYDEALKMETVRG